MVIVFAVFFPAVAYGLWREMWNKMWPNVPTVGMPLARDKMFWHNSAGFCNVRDRCESDLSHYSL